MGTHTSKGETGTKTLKNAYGYVLTQRLYARLTPPEDNIVQKGETLGLKTNTCILNAVNNMQMHASKQPRHLITSSTRRPGPSQPSA